MPQSRNELTVQESHKLFASILLVFCRLARMRPDDQNSTRALMTVFRTMFRRELTVRDVQETLQQTEITIRDAVSLLHRHINDGERINLMMNLFAFVYYSGQYDALLSLELIKFIDLMYIDIQLLDGMLDMLEKDAGEIWLDRSILIEMSRSRLFHNVMVLSTNPLETTLPLRKNDDASASVIALRLPGYLLVGSTIDGDFAIDGNPCRIHRVYRMRENSAVTLGNPQSNLSADEILSLYNRVRGSYSQKFTDGSNTLSVSISEGKMTWKCRGCAAKVNDEKRAKKGELFINDAITLDRKFSGLEILLGQTDRSADAANNLVYFQPGANNEFYVYDRPHQEGFFIEKIDGQFWLHPGSKSRILCEGKPVDSPSPVEPNGTRIQHKGNSFVISRQLTLLKLPRIVETFGVSDLVCYYKESNDPALDHVTFDLKRGEIMAIMGPSGSGKTTLLKLLTTERQPAGGVIRIDNEDIRQDIRGYQQLVGYVPQHDLLFERMTVEENVRFRLWLTRPDTPSGQRQRRVEEILHQMGLFDKRDLIVGDNQNRKISGGERRRLNIALELVSDPSILILDEPTSGLSSKDSESLMRILQDLKRQGKIIVATIHQPSATLLRSFDKLLFLDRGGVTVYVGSITGAFSFFDRECTELNDFELFAKRRLRAPEYLFDILEHTGPNDQRTYPPEYWRERNRESRVADVLQNKDDHDGNRRIESSSSNIRKKAGIRQFLILLLRSWKQLMAKKLNLVFTFIASPLLALIVAVLLRATPEDNCYSYFNNDNIAIFSFISIIVFIFLGMVNSLDELSSERYILKREAMQHVKPLIYFLAKLVPLLFFSEVQVALYILIASLILGIHGSFLVYSSYLLLAAVSGLSLGLLASALFSDRAVQVNILPLVIIPQILFAGAVIPFSSMNRALSFSSDRAVPEFCNMIPSRWLFEGLLTGISDKNYYDRTLRDFRERRLSCDSLEEKQDVSCEKDRFMHDYRDALYRNKKISLAVSAAYGKSLNSERYIHLSPKREFWGIRMHTFHFNAWVVRLLSLLALAATAVVLQRRVRS